MAGLLEMLLAQAQQAQQNPVHRLGGAGTISSPVSSSGGSMPGGDPLGANGASDPIYDSLMQGAVQTAVQKGMGGGESSGRTISGDLTPSNLDTKRGVTLQEPALQSLLQLQRRKDIPILQNIGGSYRTMAQQRALYAQKPDLAAKPGQSLHQQGLAIDINSGWLASHPVVARWLRHHDWHQFSPQGEPWHWSYGTTG